MNVLKLFSRKPKPLSLRTQPKTLVPLSSQVRADNQAVATVTQWLNHPTTRLVLDMLQNESPAKTSVTAKGLDALDYARVLGQIEGWNAAYSFMLELAIPAAQSIEPEMNFKDEA